MLLAQARLGLSRELDGEEVAAHVFLLALALTWDVSWRSRKWSLFYRALVSWMRVARAGTNRRAS